VFDRDPLIIPYRGYKILTNPPPSFGGTLLKLTFTLLNEFNVGNITNEESHDLLVSVMKAINEMREEPLSEETPRFPFEKDLIRQTKTDLENIFKGKYPTSIEGTTHISVIDSEGNAASLTASNGSNSGCFLGNTGIMLNNMMGEDDLHPFGFYSVPPGRRVSSMMSPSFIKYNGDIFAVMGSGGSKRIRTAIPQTVINIFDKKMNIHDAVESPRLHYDDDGILQIEPGFDNTIVEYLKQYYDINLWELKDMYFGGVHTVLHDLSGEGDSRRGGCFMKV
jgi:gamma-glutamyltranspeptidase/glutathione hydrolase